MYVGRSPDYRSLSNMPLKTVSFSLRDKTSNHAPSQTIPLPSEDPSEEDWLLDVYYPSVKMSSYLVAVVVTWDYQSLESNLIEGGPITKVNNNILFHEFRDRFNVLA